MTAETMSEKKILVGIDLGSYTEQVSAYALCGPCPGGVVVVNGPAYLPILPPAISIQLCHGWSSGSRTRRFSYRTRCDETAAAGPNRELFSKNILTFIGLWLLILGLILFYVFFNAPDIERGRTEVFFLMILGELVIALNIRSLRHSIFSVPPRLPLIFWSSAPLCLHSLSSSFRKCAKPLVLGSR